MFREHLTHISNLKSFTFFTFELVYKVGAFAIGKDGDGISETGERLGRDMDGTSLPADTVAGD